MLKLSVLILLLFGLTACEGNLSPFCVTAAATGADVMTKVKYRCPLTPDEQRAFNQEISNRQVAAQAQQEAQWEANNPGKCPPRLTQRYDYALAAQEDQFRRTAQFTVVSDGYGRPVGQNYVPSGLSDQLLANMRKTMEERAAMCREKGYQPAGYIPSIFGPSAYGIP